MFNIDQPTTDQQPTDWKILPKMLMLQDMLRANTWTHLMSCLLL